MLNMYPDIVYTVKGLQSSNMDRGAVDLQHILTWQVVMDGMITTFFVDTTFKWIDGNGQLIDSDGVLLDDVNPPQYSEVLEDGSAPCVGLITTDALFFSHSKYMEI